MTMRTALVTGATGFIGRHLVERLVADGVRVRALWRDHAKAPGLVIAGAEPVEGDVTRPETIAAAVQGVDVVFHLAAVVGPAAAPLRRFVDVNVGGTRNVLDACRRAARVKRVVHVSTVAVSEGAAAGTIVTEETAAAPTGRYGTTKWQAERIGHAASRAGLPIVIARPMWVYGWRSSGAAKLFRLIARRRMVLVGRAQNSIQPIAVADLVQGLLLAGTVAGIEGEVYQFAGPEVITSGQLCDDIAAALGAPPPRIRIPMPLAAAAAAAFERAYPASRGKPPIDSNKLAMFKIDLRYSTAKAERDLGWKAIVGVREGVARAAADMRANGVLP
jgi:nucleoside-diphosphate-sugar epimerase